MIEIEVTGFQSLDHVSLKVDRFTASVGRSNIGKSAIVRAVKAALTGAAGTDFVRHDPKTCSRILKDTKKCKCKSTVRLKFPDMEVFWEKGDSDNRYTLTRGGKTETFDKLDRGTPPFLSPGYDPIKMGDKNYLLNVGDQFQPIFLLGDAGSVVADVLSDVAKLDSLNAALRLVAKDKLSCNSTLKVRETDAQMVQASLTAFSGLDALVAESARLEALLANLDTRAARLAHLTDLADRHEALSLELKHLATALGEYMPSEDGIADASAELVRDTKFLLRAKGLALSLEGLSKILATSLPDETALAEQSTTLAQHTELIQRAGSAVRALKSADAIEQVVLPDDAPLLSGSERLGAKAALLEPLAKLTLDCSRLGEAAKAVLPGGEFLSRLSGIASAAEYHQKCQAVQSDLDRLAKEVSRVDQDLLGMQDEIDSLSVCPTCGQTLQDHHEAAVPH